MARSYVGIDFGACNLKAAKYVPGRRDIQKIKLNKGQGDGYEAPNIVFYDLVRDQTEIKIGRVAKKLAILDVENSVRHVKRKLGSKDWEQYIPNLGRKVNAVNVSSDIFKWLWSVVCEQAGNQGEWGAVLTVPVNFSEIQKKMIRTAAEAAGIPISTIISESFAAMFSLEDIMAEDDQIVLVFDFGSSTLDMSLLAIENYGEDGMEVTELASVGLNYGGVDIDEAIVEKIFRQKYPEQVAAIEATGAKGQLDLFYLVAKMKESVCLEDDSEEIITDSVVDVHGNFFDFELSGQELNAMLESLGLSGTITALLDELLEDADIVREDVTRVMPFGGTSNIRYFLDLLGNYFGTDIFDPEDCDLENAFMGVSIGAARYRQLLDNAENGIRIRNVVPYSIGLGLDGVFLRYIKRNERCGFITPYKPLPIAGLKTNDYKLAVYQSFGNREECGLDEEGVIYMGDVLIDRSLYKNDEAILFRMHMQENGELCFMFYEQRKPGQDPELIEEVTLVIGERNDD